MGQRATASPAAQGQRLSGRAAAARESAARHLQPPAEPDQFANARAYADGFDFSRFSTADMALIYRFARDMADLWQRAANMPCCNEPSEWRGVTQLTNLGEFVDYEAERLDFLRDRCVAEIVKRQPADEEERDDILCVRILHEIECAGRVSTPDAPTLLIEALKAWG